MAAVLAAHCPSCGGANAVSLATPDRMACGYCRYAGPPPPETIAHLRAAAYVLTNADTRGRQLNRAQRAALARAGCRKLMFIGLLVALTLPFMLLAGVCTATSSTFQWWVVLLLGFGPLAIVLVSGALGLFIMSRARRNLENACAALPPRAPGEPAGCHVCGAPLAPAPGEVVAQCGFCRADNVVSPDVLARMHDRQVLVFDAFDREVQRQSTSLGRRSELATNLALAGAASAPVLAGAAALAVAVVVISRDTPPDASVEYVAYAMPHATCLGELARAADGTAILDFGSIPPPGFEKRLRVLEPDKLEILRVADLPGRRVHTTQGAGRIVSVHEDGLALGHNDVRLTRADGSSVKQRVDGSCLVLHGDGPRKLGPFRDRGRGLAVTDQHIFTLSAGRVIVYDHRGQKLTSLAARHAQEPLFANLADKTFLAAGPSLLAVDARAATHVDDLPVDVTGMTALAGRLFVAASSAMKVYDAEGKNTASFAIPSSNALTSAGDSIFGVSADAVYRVSPEGGEPSMLWRGRPSGYVAADASHVYFHAGDEIMRVARSGGEPLVLAKAGPHVSGLLVDDQYVYWAFDQRKLQGSGPGGVVRVPKGGGQSQNLAPEARQVASLVLRAGQLYWVEEYGGALLTLGTR